MTIRHLATAAVLGLAALAAACGPTDYSSVQVMTEPTPVTGSTFAWAPVQPDTPLQAPGGIPSMDVDNPILRQRIETAINNALIARGYKLVDPAQAELLLAYRVGTQQRSQVDVQTWPGYVGGPMMCGRFGCGGGWGWGWYGPPQTSVTQINYTEGGLLLDVMNAKNGQLEWRALYRNRVTQASASPQAPATMATKLVASLPDRNAQPVTK